MKYQVQHYYTAISPALGPWESGAVVDLDEETAAWVNRDCPGTLASALPDEATNTPVIVSERAPDAPPHDRQLKRGQKRRLDRQGDPSDQGPITKADYKATVERKG